MKSILDYEEERGEMAITLQRSVSLGLATRPDNNRLLKQTLEDQPATARGVVIESKGAR
jgi:hypothetical protein